MIQPDERPDVRVFLLKPERLDMFYLRLAISMSSLRCEVLGIDQNESGVRLACDLARSRADLPRLILFHCDRERSPSVDMLRRLREPEELRAVPIVVIADAEHPDSERLAYQAGADAFIPLPHRASELVNTGRDIERFWRDHRQQHRVAPPSPTSFPSHQEHAS